MNKKSLFIIILAILFVVIGVIIFNTSGSKELELTYQTNGGVPYEWRYEIADESIVEFIRSYVVDNQNVDNTVGAPISTNYVFKGLKKGTTSITFKYVNVVDGTISKEEKHTIKVDSYKNISLVVLGL